MNYGKLRPEAHLRVGREALGHHRDEPGPPGRPREERRQRDMGDEAGPPALLVEKAHTNAQRAAPVPRQPSPQAAQPERQSVVVRAA